MAISPPTNLCIDVGNQTTALGIFKGGRLTTYFLVNNYVIPKKTENIVKSGGKSLKYAIISSVVPKIKAKIVNILKKRSI